MTLEASMTSRRLDDSTLAARLSPPEWSALSGVCRAVREAPRLAIWAGSSDRPAAGELSSVSDAAAAAAAAAAAEQPHGHCIHGHGNGAQPGRHSEQVEQHVVGRSSMFCERCVQLNMELMGHSIAGTTLVRRGGIGAHRGT